MQVSEEIAIEQEGWLEGDLDDAKYFYRRLVWQPFEEYVLPIWQASDPDEDVDEAEAAFNLRSDHVELWDDAIEKLMDRIFWDRDWTMTWTHPQVLDGIEESISQSLGLDDYFTNRLPPGNAEDAVLLAQRSLLALTEIRNWKLSDRHQQ